MIERLKSYFYLYLEAKFILSIVSMKAWSGISELFQTQSLLFVVDSWDD